MLCSGCGWAWSRCEGCGMYSGPTVGPQVDSVTDRGRGGSSLALPTSLPHSHLKFIPL